jgi:hypothetical protein
MSARTTLILLQVVGALSILPYPFVLLANIMSIAATGQTRAGAVPWILLSFYPAVWIALWVWSWRALSRGASGLAFGLSSVPILACLVVAGLFVYGWASVGNFNKESAEADRRKIEGANPLLWSIWRTAGDRRFPPIPSIPVEEALQAIEANPTLVNTPVPPYGTPLKVAVMNLSIDVDGSPVTLNKAGAEAHQQDLFRLVRALAAHGAHFGADELSDLQLQWRFRRAMHQGAVTTASENPLVWRILTRKRGTGETFTVRPDEIPFLNENTEIHGTPLYAAFIDDGYDLYTPLIEAGARLSKEEEDDAAAARALEDAFRRFPGLQRKYGKASGR